MIRSWAEHGRLIYTYYPYADIDPAGQIHPLAYFLFHQTHRFCVSYPPLFTFLSGLTFHIFGFSGLPLLPLLCGVGTCWATYGTARRLGMRSRFLLPLVMGLATPVILYSVIFWDHSAMMLITALAGYWVLRSIQETSFRHAVVAGAIYGLGIWVHELLLALFAAALLSSLPFLFGRLRFVPVGLLSGFAPVALAWGIFNFWIYGVFGGPHLGANVFQNNPDHPFSLENVTGLAQIADRATIQIAGTTFTGSQDNIFPQYIVFVCLLLISAFADWANPMIKWSAPLLSLGAAALALSLLHFSYNTHNSPSGLFEATPLLIPALAMPWRTRKTEGSPASSENIFCAWASRTCWLFVLFVVLNPMLPGADWGSRYLLPALPLLALLAIYVLEQQYQKAKRGGRGLVAVGAVGLIGISLICQGFGLAWIYKCLAYNSELNMRVRAITSPVLVTDKIWLGAELTNSTPAQPLFLVRSDDDQKIFLRVFRHLKLGELTYIGDEYGSGTIEKALNEDGQAFVKTKPSPLWKVNPMRQEGEELLCTRFERIPAK